MGSFMGHVLPGMIFLIAGAWFSIKYPYRHFTRNRKRLLVKRRCCSCNLDMIEASIKIAFPAIGILMEQVTNNGPQFRLVNSETSHYIDGNNWSHSTMYMFFVFAGIADILVCKFPSTPRGIQHLAMALAVTIEGYLFYFHTHGRKELDVRIHVLLILAIWSGAAAAFLLCILDALFLSDIGEQENNCNNQYSQLLDHEAVGETIQLNGGSDCPQETNYDDINQATELNTLAPDHLLLVKSLRQAVAPPQVDKATLKIILEMVFTVSIILQGTWFCQVATILYPPGKKGWDADSHLNVEFSTIFFAWHLASAMLYVTLVFYLVGAMIKKRRLRANL